MVKKIRNGAGYSWNDENDFTYKGTSTHRTTRGFSVDNLDTKSISQAENNYEKTFVTIRKALEDNEQFCCDDETDRLSLAQIITDSLKQRFIIRKD